VTVVVRHGVSGHPRRSWMRAARHILVGLSAQLHDAVRYAAWVRGGDLGAGTA
jgi:hypothetical protein